MRFVLGRIRSPIPFSAVEECPRKRAIRRARSCFGFIPLRPATVKSSQAWRPMFVIGQIWLKRVERADVNLERQLHPNDMARRLVDAMGMVDFSGYCSITIVRIGHSGFQTPRRIDELKAFWDGLFNEIGAEAVRYEPSLRRVAGQPPWREACDGMEAAVAPVGESEVRGAAAPP